MLNPSICYNYVVMATNADVILTSLVIKISTLTASKSFFSGLFLAFVLTFSGPYPTLVLYSG